MLHDENLNFFVFVEICRDNLRCLFLQWFDSLQFQ